MVLDMQGEGQSKQAHLFWGSATFHLQKTPGPAVCTDASDSHGREARRLARACQMVGMDVVAVCDLDRQRLSRACEALGAVGYQDYDAFLAHDLQGSSSPTPSMSTRPWPSRRCRRASM
jgi:hypothetical protein